MKITHLELETVTVNNYETWVFVLIHTDSNITGLGELNPSAPRAACVATLKQMGDNLRGRDPRIINTIISDLKKDTLGLVEVRSLSAIEQCLWDILARSLQVPLHTLLGGSNHDTIRLYANITRATHRLTPEAFAKSAKGAVADGFSAVKLAPFVGPGPIEKTEHLEESLQCVRSVRAAVGPNIDIMLDCYGLFTPQAALAIIEDLSDVGLYWFEEPVANDDWEGYLKVKERCAVPLAGGERYEFLQGFWPAIQREIFHIAMPDVGIVGGIGELHKVSIMAESCGIRVAPHGPFGPVTLAASAQVMAAHTGFLVMEYPWGLNTWRSELVDPPEHITNSHYHLSNQPGIGTVLNPKLLKEHRAK